MAKDPLSLMSGPFSQGGSKTGLEDEYAGPYKAWQSDPNPRTSGELLRAVNPVIDKAVHSYGGASKGSPTLRSRARRLALDAMTTYDPNKGKLQTHLLSQLRRLQRVGAKEQQIISVPEKVVLDRRNLVETENELRDSLGRDPSDQEIADATGLSLRRLAHIRKANVPVAEGQTEGGDDPSQAFAPASRVPGVDRGAAAWTEFVYADLGPKDRAIMDYTLGLHGTPRLSAGEIAKRLGLSPGAVSQRSAKIQQMLDEREDAGLF